MEFVHVKRGPAGYLLGGPFAILHKNERRIFVREAYGFLTKALHFFALCFIIKSQSKNDSCKEVLRARAETITPAFA